MATQIDEAAPRLPLSRERVLQTAVALADRDGVEGVSMRKIAQELGVVPMALYKHVAGKDELLGGMIDVVIAQIDPPATELGWKTAIRERILSARRALLRHPWASRVMESRTEPTPTVLAYGRRATPCARSVTSPRSTTGHSITSTRHTPRPPNVSPAT